MSIKIPIGGDPGYIPRNEIREKVRAALHVSDESVGGRLCIATIYVIVPTEMRPESIRIMMINERTLVESDL